MTCDESDWLLQIFWNRGTVNFMLRRINAIAQSLVGYYGLWPLVGGSAVSALVLGWIAHLTKSLHAYAPFSWAISGFAGALLFLFVILLAALFWLAFVSASVKRKYYEGGQKINPLETTFNEKRINISDLMPPTGRIIKGKTFVGCELVGPVNISLSGCTMSNCNTHSCDNIIVNNPKAIFLNGIVFQDCIFQKCEIYFISFLVPLYHLTAFESGFDSIVWLSDPRITNSSTNPPT